jgi:hypothetical protein
MTREPAGRQVGNWKPNDGVEQSFGFAQASHLEKHLRTVLNLWWLRHAAGDFERLAQSPLIAEADGQEPECFPLHLRSTVVGEVP